MSGLLWRRRHLPGIALAAALLASCGEPAPEAPAVSPPALLYGRPAATFHEEPGRFEAADDPATVPAAEATWLLPSDDVFGVLVGGEARAYPIGMLAYHHVVNDTVAGIPIAVTY